MRPRRSGKPLQMSLSAAQIFVRTLDAEAVEETVAQALYDWALGVGELPADEWGNPLPAPERKVVVLPPVDGFIAVIEEGGKVDRALARNLQARTGALVLAAELDGHFLAADLETFEEDGEWTSWKVPEIEGDRMPVYVDAEAALYERLRARDVPPQLIATDWEDMIETDSPVAEGYRLSAEAGVTGLDKTIVPFGEITASDLLDGPRVRPDLWVQGPSGEAMVVEARRLTGEPNAEAIASLAAIEEAQLVRILSTLAWTSESASLPQVSFRYEGVDDEQLFEGALDAARSVHPLLARWQGEEWLSVRGLVERLRQLVVEDWTAFDVGQPWGSRLEVRHEEHPNWSFLLDLAAVWSAYFESPDALDAILRAALEDVLEAAGRDAPFDAERLFPLLVGERSPGLAPLAARPFSPGVWTLLAQDVGDALRPVTRAELRDAGLGFDDALDLAVHRLDRATEEADAFVLYEQPEGHTVLGEFPDPASAARILSPAVLHHVAQQLGDECYVAVPTRDVLLAAEGSKEARGWLEREVARRFRQANLPLTPMIWTIQNGELVEDAPADLRARSVSSVD